MISFIERARFIVRIRASRYSVRRIRRAIFPPGTYPVVNFVFDAAAVSAVSAVAIRKTAAPAWTFAVNPAVISMSNDVASNENVDPAGVRAINPRTKLQATLMFNGPSAISALRYFSRAYVKCHLASTTYF